MKETIFVPEKIKVGYQNRSDTYTKKLAYVIYYDQKNVLRKEASWNSWRDGKIEPEEFTNVPTNGFVLNKKVGGDSSGWNHRQTYCRVYDPRNFEFEITVPNLLYILENTNSIKGKGLEGEFVYGWDGTDLLLIPTSSPDYDKIASFTEMVSKPEVILGKDLILGGTYRTKQNNDWIYMGRFQEYNTNSYDDKNYGKSKGNNYFFYADTGYGKTFTTLKSLSGKIVKLVSAEPVENYAELMEKLEHQDMYCPYDKTKDVYILDDLEKRSGYRNEYYFNYNDKMMKFYMRNYGDRAEVEDANYDYYNSYRNYAGNVEYIFSNYLNKSKPSFTQTRYFTNDEFLQLHEHFEFKKLIKHLANGKTKE